MYSMMLFAVAGFLVSSVAMARVPCGQRDKIVEWLAVEYKEVPIATGAHTGDC